ncbi:MAG: DUF2336 domain-containing protein, partial [Pseudomonadota bacterium]
MELVLETPAPAAAAGSRQTLLRRLIDVVAMPSSTIAPQERSVAGDILLEMLFASSNEERMLAARRLAEKSEAPPRLLRYLACCDIEVARPVLEENVGLDDGALLKAIKTGTIEHRRLIASRKQVHQLVAAALVDQADFPVVQTVLKNRGASLA